MLAGALRLRSPLQLKERACLHGVGFQDSRRSGDRPGEGDRARAGIARRTELIPDHIRDHNWQQATAGQSASRICPLERDHDVRVEGRTWSQARGEDLGVGTAQELPRSTAGDDLPRVRLEDTALESVESGVFLESSHRIGFGLSEQEHLRYPLVEVAEVM